MLELQEFELDDQVFAKMRGYPYWPARIFGEFQERWPMKNSFYPVLFYGTHDVANVKTECIIPFEENKKRFLHCKRSKFLKAMNEALVDQCEYDFTCGQPQVLMVKLSRREVDDYCLRLKHNISNTFPLLKLYKLSDEQLELYIQATAPPEIEDDELSSVFELEPEVTAAVDMAEFQNDDQQANQIESTFDEDHKVTIQIQGDQDWAIEPAIEKVSEVNIFDQEKSSGKKNREKKRKHKKKPKEKHREKGQKNHKNKEASQKPNISSKNHKNKEASQKPNISSIKQNIENKKAEQPIKKDKLPNKKAESVNSKPEPNKRVQHPIKKAEPPNKKSKVSNIKQKNDEPPTKRAKTTHTAMDQPCCSKSLSVTQSANNGPAAVDDMFLHIFGSPILLPRKVR